MRRPRAPTCTSLVEQTLRRVDDFMNVRQLSLATGCSMHQTGSALHELRHYRVTDAIIDPAGVGWWCALPPEQDQRIRTISERVEEVNPRKAKKKRQP